MAHQRKGRAEGGRQAPVLHLTLCTTTAHTRALIIAHEQKMMLTKCTKRICKLPRRADVGRYDGLHVCACMRASARPHGMHARMGSAPLAPALPCTGGQCLCALLARLGTGRDGKGHSSRSLPICHASEAASHSSQIPALLERYRGWWYRGFGHKGCQQMLCETVCACTQK